MNRGQRIFTANNYQRREEQNITRRFSIDPNYWKMETKEHRGVNQTVWYPYYDGEVIKKSWFIFKV